MADDKTQVAQTAIANAILQHALSSYRASTKVVSELQDRIDELAKILASELGDRLDNLTEAELKAFTAGKYTTTRLKGLKNVIDQWVDDLDKAMQEAWVEPAKDLADHEITFTETLMSKAASGLPEVTVTAATVYQATMETPVTVGSMGKLIDEWMSEWSTKAKALTFGVIRQGITQGQSNQQIVKALRGTQAANYKDGAIVATKREAETIVRTARSHLSGVAFDKIFDDLGVDEIIWDATLDMRTCPYCASLDRKKFKRSDRKMPHKPAHPNCRCQWVPVVDGFDLIGNRPYMSALKVKGNSDTATFRPLSKMTKKQRVEADLEQGQVKATTSYAQFFSGLSAAKQEEWLGPKRYKLYKQGNYTIDRFVDPLGKKYTLEELREQDKDTFGAIFGKQ